MTAQSISASSPAPFAAVIAGPPKTDLGKAVTGQPDAWTPPPYVAPQSAFLNLINFLFDTPPVEADKTGSDPNAAVVAATNEQIAGALIASMLTRAPVNTPPFNATPASTTPASTTSLSTTSESTTSFNTNSKAPSKPTLNATGSDAGKQKKADNVDDPALEALALVAVGAAPPQAPPPLANASTPGGADPKSVEATASAGAHADLVSAGQNSPQEKGTANGGMASTAELAFAARLTAQASENGDPGGPSASKVSQVSALTGAADAKIMLSQGPGQDSRQNPGGQTGQNSSRAWQVNVKTSSSKNGFANPLPPQLGTDAMTRATLNTNAVAAAQSTHPQSAGDGNKSGTNNEMPAPAAPSAAAEPPAAPLAPRVQDLVLRVSQPDAPNVDLQVTQRQGQVHIAVRTPDASLQTALRQNLPDLVSSLDRAGFRAETFVPHAGSGVAAMGQAASGNLSQDTSGQPQSQGSGSSGDQFANSDGRRRHSQPNQPQSQQQSSGKSTQDRLAESWRKQMEE